MILKTTGRRPWVAGGGASAVPPPDRHHAQQLDLSGELKVWDRQAVEIHIVVLRLLRQSGPGMSVARRRGMVEGLYKVTAKRIGRMPVTSVH